MNVGIKTAQREKMPTKDEMAKFARSIEEFAANTKYNYIEAVVEYCKETGLEIEVAASLINSNLKSKIENVALDNNMLKEKGVRVNPVPIGDGNMVRKGWFIDADGTNRRTSHEYTEEQQDWFYNWMGETRKASVATEGTNIGRTCCGGRCTQGKVDGEWQEVKLVNNWFKDWYCTVNWYFLHIDQHGGNVFHHQTCQATHTGRGPIGTLSNTQLILDNVSAMLSQPTIAPIVCPNQRCGCGMCVPKAKGFDDFKQLWTATTTLQLV